MHKSVLVATTVLSSARRGPMYRLSVERFCQSLQPLWKGGGSQRPDPSGNPSLTLLGRKQKPWMLTRGYLARRTDRSRCAPCEAGQALSGSESVKDCIWQDN